LRSALGRTVCAAAAAIAAGGGVGLSARPAEAATSITYEGYGTALPADEVLVTDFTNPLVIAAGYGLTGTGAFLTGTSNLGAAPAFSATSRDPHQYLSLEKGQSETLTTPLLKSISLYIGSIDRYNWITFLFQGGGQEIYSGADLAADESATANGDRRSSRTNGRFTFTFTDPITEVQLYSSNYSFEVADIGAAPAAPAAVAAAPVPEPAAWTMMLLGFGGLGAVLRRGRAAARLA
jgi:hypothetical protein